MYYGIVNALVFSLRIRPRSKTLKLLIMKKKLHDQCTMLGSNSRRWIVGSKSLISSQFFVVLTAFLMSAFTATAQEMNTPSAERSRTANNASTPSTVEQSALNPELKELGIKINLLLNQVRTQLADASNKQWFSENLQSSLSAKSAQVCPNIALVDLMLSTESFILTPEMDKQELLYVIDFLNVSINGMLTK